MPSMIMIRDLSPNGYEVRIATYSQTGALAFEETRSGIKALTINASVSIVKIGNREVHMISNTRLRTIFREDKGLLEIVEDRG